MYTLATIGYLSCHTEINPRRADGGARQTWNEPNTAIKLNMFWPRTLAHCATGLARRSALSSTPGRASFTSRTENHTGGDCRGKRKKRQERKIVNAKTRCLEGPTRKNGRWQWASATAAKKSSRERGGVLLGVRTDDRDGDHGRDDYPPPHDHGNDGSPGRTIPRCACVCIDAGRVCALRRRALRRGVGGDMRERLDRARAHYRFRRRRRLRHRQTRSLRTRTAPLPPPIPPPVPMADGPRSVRRDHRRKPAALRHGKSARRLAIFFPVQLTPITCRQWRLGWSMCRARKIRFVHLPT